MVRFRRVPEQIPCEVPKGSECSYGISVFMAKTQKLLSCSEFILFWKVLHFDIQVSQVKQQHLQRGV